MIKNVFIFTLTILCSMRSFAGGDSSPAKIEKIAYKSNRAISVEFTWSKENGFVDGTKQTKALFELYEFDDSFFYQNISKFFLKSKYENSMSKEKFENCINFLIEAYKSGEEIEIGQIGGGKFREKKDDKEMIIVPYAELGTTHSGKKACFFTAAPL